jgi:hypothetical protein
MGALVTEAHPPTCPLSRCHRWPRASTSVEGPATMRATQELSGPLAVRRTGDGSGSGRRQSDGQPRPCRADSWTVGSTSAGGRLPSRCLFVGPMPWTNSASATASATASASWGRQCRGIDASHVRAAAALVASRPRSPTTTTYQVHRGSTTSSTETSDRPIGGEAYRMNADSVGVGSKLTKP